jgi:hypothetical protein
VDIGPAFCLFFGLNVNPKTPDRESARDLDSLEAGPEDRSYRVAAIDVAVSLPQLLRRMTMMVTMAR